MSRLHDMKKNSVFVDNGDIDDVADYPYDLLGGAIATKIIKNREKSTKNHF